MKLSLIIFSILFTCLVLILGTFFLVPDFSFFGLRGQPTEDKNIVAIERGELTKIITINNAKLVALDDFELSFPFPGRVESISVQEGLVVSAQSTLLELDTTELELERQKALALVHQSTTNLAQARAGVRSGEIAVFSDKVKGAKTSLSGSKKNLVDALQNAYVTTDDALHNLSDRTLVDPTGDAPQINFILSDTDLENEIETDRKSLEGELSDFKNDVDGLDTSDNLTKAHTSAEKKVENIRKYLDNLASGLNKTTASGSLTEELLTDWRSALTLARTNVSTAKSNLSAMFNAYQNAGQSLTLVKSELDVQGSGNVVYDIDMSRFQLEEAERMLDIANEKLLQATLVSPQDNLIVKKIYPNTGERLSAHQPAIYLATGALQIQIDIPEEDIAGVTTGNIVHLTLGAFPNHPPIEGVIDTIEPNELSKNESIYYRAFATLKKQEPEWRTGMTGEVEIRVGATTALQVPKSAVYKKNGKQYIQKVSTTGTEEQEVTTGLSGENTLEITGASIKQGDTVLRYPKLP